MSCYHLRSPRPYTEKDGKLTFTLKGINVEGELKKQKLGKWVVVQLKKDFLYGVTGGCGVYVVSIRNKKNNKEDVCYIGSSKYLPGRLYNHDILSFLSLYLSQNFYVNIHILYCEKFRSVESKLITTLCPFLNRGIPAPRMFYIGKKEVKKIV